MATIIKKVSITDIYGTEVVQKLGAEAENIDVSRNSDEKIITDLSQETPVSVEGLATTLKNLEDRPKGHVIVGSDGTELPQRSKLKISGATLTDASDLDATLLSISGGGGGASSIRDLTDVTIITPSDGQVLSYNNTTSQWVNKSVGTAAECNSTTSVTQDSADLITSGAVFSYVDTMITQALNASY